MAYFPRIFDEVETFAALVSEKLRPATYEVIAPATGLVQSSEFLNTTEMGPFVVCSLRHQLANTPVVTIEADGQQLMHGSDLAGSGIPAAGVQSDRSLESANGGEGDVIPAPIVVRGRMLLRALRSAGGATTDKWLLNGFHVSERMASMLRRRGEAFWLTLPIPAAGNTTPFTADKWVDVDHLVVRLTTPTAARFRLVFGSYELWPLGLTQLATLPTGIDGGSGGDVGVRVAPGTRIRFDAVNPSAAAVVELAGRCWYGKEQPQ